MIKAVIFDIDGVLLDSFEANYAFYKALIKKLGYKPPTRSRYKKIFHMPMWGVIKSLTGETNEKKLKEFWNVGKRMKYPLNLAKLPIHSVETVKRLSKEYRLAIVTARIKQGVKILFKLSKLNKYFEIVVGYENFTHPKPHPESLLTALKLLKLKSSEAVYIGDTNSDILAAKAAGMKIILYSKKKLKGADYYFTSFKQLPKIIQNI